MDFYKERWKEKFQEEHPELKKPSFFELKEIVRGNEVLEGLLDELKESCLRHTKLKRELKEASGKLKKGEATQEEVIEADRACRIAHKALVSDFNIFVRNCKKCGRSHVWRDNFSPDELTFYVELEDWAAKIAQELKEAEKKKS